MFQTLHFQKKNKIIDKEYLITILEDRRQTKKPSTFSISYTPIIKCRQSQKTDGHICHTLKKNCIQFLELLIYRKHSMTAAISYYEVKSLPYIILM